MHLRSMRIAAVVAGAIALAGCATPEARWSGDAASLAVYATQVPLYPGAKAEDAMGSESWGDDPESYAEGMTFWFVVDAPMDKVVAWYDMKLVHAKRERDDDNNVVYTLTPTGAEPGEDVGVIVEEGKFRVFEHTRRGKHKDA